MRHLVIIMSMVIVTSYTFAGFIIPKKGSYQDYKESYNLESSYFEWTFIGLYGTIQRENVKQLSHIKDNQLGVRFGVQGSEVRLSGIYLNNFNKGSEFTLQTDYLFDTWEDIGFVQVRPYIGVTLSRMKRKDTIFFSPGLSFGILTNLSENIDMDISYSVRKAINEEIYNNQHSLTLGVNYFF